MSGFREKRGYRFTNRSVDEAVPPNFFLLFWREHVGIEPTRDNPIPHTGFEDQGTHQHPSAPTVAPQKAFRHRFIIAKGRKNHKMVTFPVPGMRDRSAILRLYEREDLLNFFRISSGDFFRLFPRRFQKG